MPLLQINWTDGQKALYGLQLESSNAFSYAFGAMITNYAGETHFCRLPKTSSYILTTFWLIVQYPNGF